MRFFDNYINVFFTVFFIGMMVWSGILFFNGQKTTDWNYLYNAGYSLLFFTVGIIALFGVRLHGLSSAVGKELLSIALAMLSYSVGLFVWCYFNILLRIETPFPSIADFFFVLYIPFLGYGIISLLKAFGLLYSKRILAETIAIFGVAAILIFFVGNPPDLSNEIPAFVKSLNIFYLIGDSFLISLGYMLIRLTGGRIHGSFFFLVGALFAMSAADLLFGYRTSNGTYWNGDITDMLFVLSGFLFGLGVTKIVSSQLRIASGISNK